jgi:hypothetical protein
MDNSRKESDACREEILGDFLLGNILRLQN